MTARARVCDLCESSTTTLARGEEQAQRAPLQRGRRDGQVRGRDEGD